jgi:two-component system chemotaxis response regulator CheB
MPGHDIIAIGASTGGVEALGALVGGLPTDLAAAVFVVLHVSPHGKSTVPHALSRAGPLPASHAVDGAQIVPGRIYVAPPDHHLLLEPGRMRVTRGPKENRFRPAIDPLFRSAAYEYGPRVVGVVLTGALDDGTVGLWEVKARGGVAVVQDPAEALFSSMPRNAMSHVQVDHCLSLAEISALLPRLAQEPSGADTSPAPERLGIETRIAMEDKALEAGFQRLGEFSPFTCPECHGALLRLKTGGILRFRCHTGHAFTASSLLAELMGSIEDVLWTSVRAVQESVVLMHHIAGHLQDAGDAQAAEAFHQKAAEAAQRAEAVRQVVLHHEKVSGDDLTEDALEE